MSHQARRLALTRRLLASAARRYIEAWSLTEEIRAAMPQRANEDEQRAWIELADKAEHDALTLDRALAELLNALFDRLSAGPRKGTSVECGVSLQGMTLVLAEDPNGVDHGQPVIVAIPKTCLVDLD